MPDVLGLSCDAASSQITAARHRPRLSRAQKDVDRAHARIAYWLLWLNQI
ncbi:hypothetical protein J5X84_15915 [Streptosporangiaceae bacterium NEAU-GS5]|nr:hypothetical protein [Streptosporangiaceae bacterium NEAU-GS5]